MSLFTLPFEVSAITPIARSHHPSQSPRKRKRQSLSDAESSTDDDEAEESNNNNDRAQKSLLAGLTNPLSLTPDEVRQYRVAGLSLDQPLPSKVVADFPHRPLPSTPLFARTRDDAADSEEGVVKLREEAKRIAPGGGSHLRVHHLGVLIAALHRCLLQGDIPRASRAWSMLLRSELSGHALDLRGSGYWGIGAELLIRSSQWDGTHSQTQAHDIYSSQQSAITTRDEETEEERAISNRKTWGSKAGLELAKEYYERLILQYPYRQRWDSSVSALDFWPAMLACEIYGIQAEQQKALEKLAEQDEDDSGDESEYEDDAEVDVAGDYAALERRATIRRARRDERLFVQREEVRQEALQASETIAGRMDELMAKPPFSDSHALLRLRGMLALYVGDLSVPSPGVFGGDGEERESPENLMSDDLNYRDSSRRIVLLQRRTERNRGLKKQQAEYDVAVEKFQKISKDTGMIDEGIRALHLVVKDDISEQK